MTSGELDGKQVPQVPHVQGAIGLRADGGRFAGSFDFRLIGQQYDDDRNDFLLNADPWLDARAAWRLSKGIRGVRRDRERVRRGSGHREDADPHDRSAADRPGRIESAGSRRDPNSRHRLAHHSCEEA